MDSSSASPKHDFRKVFYEHGVAVADITKRPSKKEASKHSKKLSEEKERIMESHVAGKPVVRIDSSIDREIIKRCERCSDVEDRIVKPKFKFCSKCQKVSYCSKNCQQADWKDHKVLCPYIWIKNIKNVNTLLFCT